MRIALFDSGLGGLTVLGHARRALPDEEFLFFADRDHVPYGTKTVDEVRGFVRDAFRFLVEEERAEAVVIACNTATSVSADEMRRCYDISSICSRCRVSWSSRNIRSSSRRTWRSICARRWPRSTLRSTRRSYSVVRILIFLRIQCGRSCRRR